MIAFADWMRAVDPQKVHVVRELPDKNVITHAHCSPSTLPVIIEQFKQRKLEGALHAFDHQGKEFPTPAAD